MRLKESKGVPMPLTVVPGLSLLSSPAVPGDIPGPLGRVFATLREKRQRWLVSVAPKSPHSISDQEE